MFPFFSFAPFEIYVNDGSVSYPQSLKFVIAKTNKIIMEPKQSFKKIYDCANNRSSTMRFDGVFIQ